MGHHDLERADRFWISFISGPAAGRCPQPVVSSCSFSPGPSAGRHGFRRLPLRELTERLAEQSRCAYGRRYFL